MNIVVLHRYPLSQVSGTNASFVPFLEGLRERGHTVYFLTFRDTAPVPPPAGVTIVELPCRFQRGNPLGKILKTALWILLAPILALKLRRRFAIDLFYCDDSVPYYGFLTKVLVRRRAAVVVRLGDLQSGYNFADRGFSRGILFTIALGIERFMWRTLDGVVAISGAFRSFLQSQGVDERKITVVRESVNLALFGKPHRATLREETGIPPDATVIMFHGALVPCKGIATFISAIPRILSQRSDLVFVIAGGGSQERRLRSLGEEWVDQGRLYFIGWYDHLKLRGYLEDVDIGVVMRSGNFANNFVVTTCLLEYWASHKPAVVPNLEAFGEVVVAGENGVFFRPEDPEDLARCILALLETRESWASLGAQGYRTAACLFDHRTIAKNMVEALEGYARVRSSQA